MKLYKEILIHLLAKEDIQVEVTFPNMQADIHEICNTACYQALALIKETLNEDSTRDEECFMRIEAIMCRLEDMLGIVIESRHDGML